MLSIITLYKQIINKVEYDGKRVFATIVLSPADIRIDKFYFCLNISDLNLLFYKCLDRCLLFKKNN